MGLPPIISACLYGRRHVMRMSLTYGKVLFCMCRFHQPFRRTHRHGCMAGYLCLMPKGIIILQSGSLNIIPICNVLLLLGITNVWYNTPGLRIRMNDGLSNKHHVLSPKYRGSWSRKSPSVEKTSFFEVFRKALNDSLLQDYSSVISRFTKSEFARA